MKEKKYNNKNEYEKLKKKKTKPLGVAKRRLLN